jgi:sigma-B regulation protein RsbU (phosphoserine phosphatase)
MSSVVRILFSQRVQSGDLLPLLYTLAALVLVAEVISLVIGVSITRTITDAVEELYEGTQKVMRGDFSHRIQVRGNEQIAELSRSFNQMTENVERLLMVAKEKERMQADLEIAREVQSQLFPKTPPTIPCLEIRAICHPARLVSGDYYDFQTLNGLQVAIAVGDVAGKGISAALLMATLQAALRSQLREARERAGLQGSPAAFCSASIVSKINQQLYEDTSPEKYATFFLAIYDDSTGALTYTNAGHLPPVLVRKRRAERLEVNGLVVGAFPFARYQESRILLEPGDTLVCFTDGLTEPENEFGEQFGEERLIDALIRHAGLPLDELIAELTAEVRRFTGAAHKAELEELHDDMTILVARRLAA